MKRTLVSVLLLLSLVVMGITPVFASSGINGPEGVVIDNPEGVPPDQGDNRPDPLTTHQKALKEQAIDAKLNGKASGKVKEVARGQYVELAREGEDPVWTVLGEFSDLAHNQIAEPDREYNNTTIWTENFSRDHFMELLFSEEPGFSSMRSFYIEASSNRYAIYGDVTNWVTVPGAAAGYDDDISGPAVWQFLIDSVNGWYDAQIAAGKTPAEINEYLSGFDIWDRYDYDGDGNFDEADGYIDHFQSVHAGEGNEAGGGVLGDAAIWSHSWYAYSNLIGVAGPDFNKFGGVKIGESDYWVGKYTIQPENGGVGVFAHEYGHDLGLPDLYDTSGGENSTAFWTIMSSGSWLNDGTVDIGSRPNHFSAWEKFQLGWLDYEVAFAGKTSTHRLGPAETSTKQAQGLFVVLPPKTVVTNIGAPHSGEQFYYSSRGDNLDNWMYRPMTLPVDASLSAYVRYNIELDWDYAYLVVSTDQGATWTSVQTNRSTTYDPNGQNFGHGITGVANNWVTLTADLSAFTGDVWLGFRYWTDTNTGGFGFLVDDIVITGQPDDGAETDAGWTYDPESGFHVSNGTESRLANHYYVAEFRQYRGYDSTLKTGPYNFGFLDNPLLGDFVEHFPYQDGMLLWYWDTSQSNNNVRQHPGQGLLLPIDAHPEVLKWSTGAVMRNRIQAYDATFGFEATDALTLHLRSVATSIPSLPAVRMFDDRLSYYRLENPMGSVIVPNTGTQIRIQSINAQGNFMQVEVRRAK